MASATETTKLTDAQMETLKSTKSETEWNVATAKIKAETKGGEFPSDWYARVLASGMMRQMTLKWKEAAAAATGAKTTCPGCGALAMCTKQTKTGRFICASCDACNLGEFLL